MVRLGPAWSRPLKACRRIVWSLTCGRKHRSRQADCNGLGVSYLEKAMTCTHLSRDIAPGSRELVCVRHAFIWAAASRLYSSSKTTRKSERSPIRFSYRWQSSFGDTDGLEVPRSVRFY